MKKILTLVSALAWLTAMQAQNITVADAIGQSPETFVRNHLMGGNGVHVFNVKYNNSPLPITSPTIGTFDHNGFVGIKMDSGIIMTTGNIDVAPGPNNSPNATHFTNMTFVDNELSVFLSGTIITSCSTLDFDFVSVSDHISFNYIFGSEEYPEKVCSVDNDIFAFLVTGPDPENGELVTRNAATIPGSVDEDNPDGIPVSINSVNNGVPGNFAYFSDYGTGCHYNYTHLYHDNVDTTGAVTPGVQYDGYTEKMTALVSVIPCEVYHVHISVCNVGDYSNDSGVLLEGGSLTASSGVLHHNDFLVPTLYGSCPYDIPLSLAQSDFSQGTMYFSFGGDAVPGVDFVLVDGQGNLVDSLGVDVFNDTTILVIHGLDGADLSEPKTVELYVASSLCSDFPQLLVYDTMRFVLQQGEAGVELRDTTITCSYACFEVSAPLVSGEEAVSYRWEPATGIDDPYCRTSSAAIFETSDYMLIATGGSGCYSDTAMVHIVITGEDPLGIGEAESDSDIKVYPNPANSIIHIDAMQLQRVELFTLKGVKVYEAAYNGVSGTVDIPVAALPAGVYGLRISTAAGMKGAKIMINK